MTLRDLDVQHAAAAARLTLPVGQAAVIAAELAPVLAILEPLRSVRSEPAGGAVGVGAGGMPLRADDGPPYDLARPAEDLAPSGRAGYVLIARLGDGPGTDADGMEATQARPFDDVVGDDALAAELELGA